jgi:hypothetical protein
MQTSMKHLTCMAMLVMEASEETRSKSSRIKLTGRSTYYKRSPYNCYWGFAVLKIYFNWGELYLTQYGEYSHNSKCYYTVKLILGVVGLALFHLVIKLLAPPIVRAILMIAWYVLGRLFFVTLQANNKRR